MRVSARRGAIGASIHSGCVTTFLRALVGIVLLSGCVSRHPQPIAPHRSPARDSLLSTDAHRADSLRSLGTSGSSRFAAEIVYLRAGVPVAFGRTNVVAMLAAGPISPIAIAWQPLGGGLSLDALCGYTFGVAVYSEGANRPVGVGRYLAFWSRRRGAPWEIAAYAELGAASPAGVAAENVAADRRPPTMSPRAVRAAAAIAAADSAFADAGSLLGTPMAFAGAAAEEAVIFAGPELVVGPDAIKEFFDAQQGTSLNWHPVYAFAAPSADLGFSIGESVATSRGQSGAAVQRFGKYLTIWRRQPNGDWKYVADGGNSRPSPVEKAP
jgi:ketosteroid isomerase-like protein